MEKKLKHNKKEENIILTFISILVLLMAYSILAFAYGYIVWYTFGGQAGLFGDMFGAFNAFFSGLALFFVAFTIYQQQKLIKNQSREIEKTIELTLMQSNILAISAKTELYKFERETGGGSDLSSDEIKEMRLEIKSYRRRIQSISNEGSAE